MAQKQHRSLLNAGTLLDFAQKLNPSASSRDRRASSGSPQGQASLSSPASTPDSSSSQLIVGTENTSSVSGNYSLSSPHAVEHGEDVVLALTSGETSGLANTNSPTKSQSRSPEMSSVPGHREASLPGGAADGPVSGSMPPGASDSEQSVGGVGSRSSGNPPVVVILGGDFKEEERQDNCLEEGGVEGRKEEGTMTNVAMPPVKQTGDVMLRDKDVKRSTSFKQSIFRRSLKPSKGDRRSSESVSKDGSGIDSESEDACISLPSPIHVSHSCPTELPLLEETSQQNLGFETSGSSLSSPTEKLSPVSRTDKEDKSPKSAKRNSKKSPWYTVLSSSYKSKSEEFRKYFKNIHNSEKLIADYSCALQKDILVQGRMYVTENWLCFYANIFKWETLLTIRLKEITAITKERTIRLIPNAVQIATESEKYFFTSFMSRDRTFLLLFKVWQNALLDQKMPTAEYWIRVHSNYGANLGLGPGELPEDYVQPNLLQDETENGENEFDESKSQGTEGMDDDDEEEEEEEEEDDDDEEDDDEDEGKEPFEVDGDKGPEVTGQEVKGESELSRAAGVQDVPASKSLDEEGEVQSLEPKPLHANAKEYMNTYFSVSVDTFFTSMYNKENLFYRNFLLHRKHTDITIGEWEQGEGKDIRNVSYTFHLNNAVGPKSCGVEERQIFFKDWSRPGHSYVVNLEVWQTGVPYADYFHTEARMVITRVSGTSCHVRVCAHLIYKKSPWGPIKGFIERNAESGLNVKHAELDTYGKQHLESRAPVKPVTKKTKKRKHAGKASKEEMEEQARPIRRVESMTKVNLKTSPLARYLPSWLRTDSRNIMLLICLFLTFLSIVNVSLFLQLQSLEKLAVRTDHEWSSGSFSDKFKEIPQTKEEWSSLLQKQLYYHEMEMERWREVLGLCIDLMKKMEVTLQELHSGIKPSRIPDLDKVFQNADMNSNSPEE